MKKEPRVAIVILNWNGKEDTLACLHSLKKQTYGNFEVILVDNGSKDDSTLAFQKEFPEHFLVLTNANLGYAGGNNAGIDHALHRGADFVFLLNNDTVLDEAFLTVLLKEAKENPKAGILGGKVVRFSDPKTLDHLGGIWDPNISEFKASFFEEKAENFSEKTPLDYISGCGILIRKEVFAKVGKLDPAFFLLWEETDLCTRAKKAGFEIWAVPEALLYHKVSASFSGIPLMQYYWWRNRLIWMQKNLSKEEYRSCFRKIVRKEILKCYRHTALKSAELFLLKLFFPRKIPEKKVQKLRRLQAGCKGIYDFYAKNWGGPIQLYRS